ncbi:hypothetical protein KDN24_06740 [Bacillus sp. Bva_UNVM-123]|uniref:hypothetical protein n=1 Tax=Bacillus sp. Bva_UNVM-123 TaxID=2829798 RepID=UPI00391F866E
MSAEEKIKKAIKSCNKALEALKECEKRKTIGLIDEVEYDIEAAKWILINEVIEQEGKL